jgi:hypothetical protein
MSSVSCVVLTTFVGYAMFYYVKVSQVKNLSTPLRRAYRDDRDGHIICIFGAPEMKSSMGTTWKALEDPRTIIIIGPGTKPTTFHSIVK